MSLVILLGNVINFYLMNHLKALLIVIIIVSPLFVHHSVFSKQAATIDELAEMFDIKRCAGCHADKYEEWKTSNMGNSVVDPRVLNGMRTFIRLTIEEEDTMGRKDLTICLDCHVPQIKDAAPELVLHIADLVLTAVEDKDVAKREGAKKELSKLNLNCLGCHNLKATGFNVKPEEKVIYGPDEVKNNPHASFGFLTKKSELLTTSEMCAQCHHCPPDVPWKECPTLYTSYIEDFIQKGRKETCQDCHMAGEKRSHKFFGPQDINYLKSAIDITVNARTTNYIDIYENKRMPVAVVQVFLTNKAGHVIPHGCVTMPKMSINIIIKDQDGGEIFTSQREFSVGDLYFKGGKQVAMAEWDVTAMERFDLGIKPIEPNAYTFIIPLKTNTKSLSVETEVKYLYTRDETFTIGKVIKKVSVED